MTFEQRHGKVKNEWDEELSRQKLGNEKVEVCLVYLRISKGSVWLLLSEQEVKSTGDKVRKIATGQIFWCLFIAYYGLSFILQTPEGGIK